MVVLSNPFPQGCIRTVSYLPALRKLLPNLALLNLVVAMFMSLQSQIQSQR
nr:MAG TPA: hypothetical protein [Caudoviricetes sp.]